MSNRFDTSSPSASARRPRAVLLLAAVLGIETAGMAAVLVILVVDLLTLRPDSYASAIALTVMAALATVWLSALTAAFWRGSGWSRAGAITWQVLQLAVAVGAFQGVFAQPAIGWALLVPSVLAVVLLFTRSVVAHTRGGDGARR